MSRQKSPGNGPASGPGPAPAGPVRPIVVGGWRDTFAAWCGRVVTAAAAWSVISFVFRPVHPLRRVDDVFGLVNLPAGPSAFSIVLLFIVGGAVRRRMRVSLWVLLGFQALAAGNIIAVLVAAGLAEIAERDITPLQWVVLVLNSGLTTVATVLLVKSRAAFSSRLERGARRRALAVLVIGLASSVTVAVLLTLAFPNTLTTPARRVTWAVRAALGVEPTSSEAGWQGLRGHHWIAVQSGALSALALAASALIFLRSTRAKAYLSAQDELGIRALLLEAGERDSLGYFATRHDKSVVFSADHRAAVTYRVLASVSLTSADPLGPPSCWAPAIIAWLTEARTYGWIPAVLSASEEGAEAYVAAGLKALPLGDEAIIEADTFTLEGPTMQPVRRAVQRVRRSGYTITVRRHADLTDQQVQQMKDCAAAWRGTESERGFSMALGRLGGPADGGCVAVLAHDGEGRLRALLSLVPWGVRGLSLDLMRRDPEAENGVVEAMVAGLVDRARNDLGVHRISLNFAAFRGVFGAAERVGASALTRLASRVLSLASRFWQIESLYRSNARYLPRWTPRYLCYDSSLSLTQVALAAGSAEGHLAAFSRSHERAADGEVYHDGGMLPFADAVVAQEKAVRRTRPSRRLSQQQQVRRAKLERLTAAGVVPYPATVPRSGDVGTVVARFDTLAPAGTTGERVSVTGRVRALRDLGGLVFAVLQDGPDSIQAMVSREHVGAAEHRLFRAAVDLGDQVGVTGEVVRSHRGELSVLAHSWVMAAKCLRPIPDARGGLVDPDARVRLRHLDLIVHPDSMAMLQSRSTAVRAVREALHRRGFTEVETPMLQTVQGGANARPFVTHINAYNCTLYLRIAPELFLKRLCVGGMRRIFELNRSFRNEGVDATHNPEFTSVEAYQAYGDYLTMRELTHELIIEVATAVHGRPVALRPQPDGSYVEVDLSGPWRSVSVHRAVSEACGMHVTADTTLDDLVQLCARWAVAPPPDASAGRCVAALYEHLVEGRTTHPTFYLDFPVETSPLTRAHRRDPRLAERWDLVAFGLEVGTAYSELVDPLDQRERLTEQAARAAAGDPEAMQVDEAFLAALEHAMPPTGGLGIGIDRLMMMLTGATIRHTLTFPYVRPGGRA